jgi:hypothetical protein
MKEMCLDLKVCRYVEDDPYSNIGESDIIVSTILSLGTAIDIKGLITVINTVSIKSRQANIQVLGRLREKKGKQMQYWYLYSNSIVKHIEYHRYRLDILKPRIKDLYMYDYTFNI